jgi:nicotinamidase-related amidase
VTGFDYLLVHLDQLEPAVTAAERRMERALYAEVVSQAHAARTRTLVLTPGAPGSALIERLTRDVPGWRRLTIGPDRIDQLASAFASSELVLVAGYARDDCVARAMAALAGAGRAVALHDAATLPLSRGGRRRLIDIAGAGGGDGWDRCAGA